MLTTVDERICDARRGPMEKEMGSQRETIKDHETRLHGVEMAVDKVPDALDRIESFNQRMDERVTALEKKPLQRLNAAIDAVIRWGTVALLIYLIGQITIQ